MIHLSNGAGEKTITAISFKPEKKTTMLWKRKGKKGDISNEENFKAKKCSDAEKVLLRMNHNVPHEQVSISLKR